MRGNMEKFSVLKGAPVNLNARTPFSAQFPLGAGWYELCLRLNVAVTIGTGTGPITEGLMNFLRQIEFYTDLNERIVDNIPARALYKMVHERYGAPPRVDAIAAATATYRMDIRIPFADWKTLRPEDLILDTSRYNSMTMNLLTGPLTDLFTAPGTATVVLTCDVDILKSKGRWPSKDAPPIGFQTYSLRPIVDANAGTYIDLERAPDLSVKRLFIHTSTAGVAGLPWYGVNSDAIIDTLTVDTGDDFVGAKNITWQMMQEENKDSNSIETIPTGVAMVDYVRDGSLKSACYTGDRNQLRLTWINQGGVGANSFVTAMVDGYRALKQAPTA